MSAARFRDVWHGPVPAKATLLALPACAATMLYLGLSHIISLLRWVDPPYRYGLLERDLTYHRTVITANFIDNGFVRRGLGGTIARFTSDDLVFSGLAFHVLSLVALIIPVCILLRRIARNVPLPTALFAAAFIIISPQTFRGWGWDTARTDLLAIAVIAWALIGALAGRWITVAVLLLVGSLVHETVLIFGLPLLVVVAATERAKGRASLPPLIRAGVLFSAGLAVLLSAQVAFGPSPESVTRFILLHGPQPTDPGLIDIRDCAIYMLVTGFRGIRTAVCYNILRADYGLAVIGGMLIAALSAVALGLESRWRELLVAVLLPLLFMDVVGNDLGRWIRFAVANLWFLAAVGLVGGGALPSARIILGVTVLTVLTLGGISAGPITPFGVALSRRLGVLTHSSVGSWMSQCDPAWRDIIYSDPQRLAFTRR